MHPVAHAQIEPTTRMERVSLGLAITLLLVAFGAFVTPSMTRWAVEGVPRAGFNSGHRKMMQALHWGAGVTQVPVHTGVEGGLNCTALFEGLDRKCGVNGWGCHRFPDGQSSSSCDADGPTAGGNTSNSKCVLTTISGDTAVGVLIGGQSSKRVFFVYQHHASTSKDDLEAEERRLLNVTSPYLVQRLGACSASNLPGLIFVADRLPLSRQTPNRAPSTTTLEGLHSPTTAKKPCNRLRAAAGVIGSVRALNKNGFTLKTWNLAQWGYDASGRVVLIDVAGPGRQPASIVSWLVDDVHPTRGSIDLGQSACPTSLQESLRSKTSFAMNVMATRIIQRRTGAPSNGTADLSDEANRLWRLYQSSHLLCLVERVALSDDLVGLMAETSLEDRKILFEVYTLIRKLQHTILPNSVAASPTDAMVIGVASILTKSCS
jgi:hypothetical protein